MSYSYKKYWQNTTVHQAIEKNKVEQTILSEPQVPVEVVVVQEPTIEEVILVVEEPPQVKKKKNRRKK